MKIVKETIFKTPEGVRCYNRQDVAKDAGVSIQTLKLWEDAGVIPPPIRDDNNYRYWVQADYEKIMKYAGVSRKERYGSINPKTE